MKRSNTIRLTESRLYGMIREAVKNVLMESTEEDDYESTGYAGKDGEIFRNPKNGHVKKVKRGSKYKTGQNKVGDYVSTGYAGKNGEIFHNPKNGHIKRINDGDLKKQEYMGVIIPTELMDNLDYWKGEIEYYINECGLSPQSVNDFLYNQVLEKSGYYDFLDNDEY